MPRLRNCVAISAFEACYARSDASIRWAGVVIDRPTSSAERQRQCSWCGDDFRARQDGGKAQRFCRPACRQAFHRALRTWAWDQWQNGEITTDVLQRLKGRVST